MKSIRSKIYRFVIPVLLMASLFSFELASASGPTCSVVFSEQSSIDRTILDLASMRISLDQAKANGINSIELTALSSEYRKKEQAVVEFLEINKIMTRQEFTEKLKQEIQKIQNEKQGEQKKEDRRRREQEEQLKISVIDGTRAVMHRVEPGSFKMGEVGKQVDVTLTKPFDMQATQMTQIIWRTVVDLVTQKLPGKYRIYADPSSFNGDTRPVELVSFNDIQIWIKALNELSAIGEPSLADLIPGHKKGDVYRLPTEAEWEFVVRGRGQYNDKYHFGNDPTQLGEYAWFIENSDYQTHPVAQKKPLVIDDKEFYDLHGNVAELVQDWYSGKLPGGVDPQGPAQDDFRVHRGGSFSYSYIAKGFRSGFRAGVDPQSRSNAIGFRLVRTVP